MHQASPEKQPLQVLLNRTLFSVLAQTGCLTLVIALTALAAGLWLDTRLDTRPWITVVMVVLSAPVAFVVIYFRVKAATAHLNKPPAQTEGVVKEEEIGDRKT